jgi:hypothetical protein
VCIPAGISAMRRGETTVTAIATLTTHAPTARHFGDERARVVIAD